MKDVPFFLKKILLREELTTKKDFLFVINRLRNDIDSPLNMDDLDSVLSQISSLYKTIQLPKKNKSIRTIYAPYGLLRAFQDYLLFFFQEIYNESFTPDCVYGFVLNRSIVQNAKCHVGKKFVLNMDLSDFFGSISSEKISVSLARKPFRLSKNNIINKLITDLVTYNGSLPQGAPTSPILSNIVCHNLDFALVNLANRYHLKYTRYADDMTFSTNWDIDFPSIINTITQKCEKHGFKVNKSKTRLRDQYSRQTVTGLVVNQKVNLKREFIKTTRAMLNNWEKHGLNQAQTIFDKHYGKIGEYRINNVVRGRIDFIGLVLNQPGEKDNKTYKSLINKYTILANCINFDYVGIEAYRIRLTNLNIEGEITAKGIDIQGVKKERFIKYCNICFQQLEEMYKYYYLVKFDGNFNEIGLHLLKKTASFNNQITPKSVQDNSVKIEEQAKTNAPNLTSFTHIKAIQLQRAYINDNYYSAGRDVPFALDLIRRIRNFSSHGSPITTLSEKELRDELLVINKRMEAVKTAGKKRTMPSDEVKVIKQVKEYDWIAKSPFEEVQELIKSVSQSIEFIIKDKKALLEVSNNEV